MRPIGDIAGRRFGMLTAFSRAPSSKSGAVRWHCRCDCGRETIVRAQRLTSEATQACGCQRGKGMQTRAKPLKKTKPPPEYSSWSQMTQRCHNPKNPHYKDYGARGIVVCEEWRRSFSAFLRDVGARPSSSHSIERIDNDGNYESGNVRWATKKEQARNRRSSRIVGANGIRRTVAEWSDVSGLRQTTIARRLDNGWEESDAVTLPLQRKKAS